VDVSEVTTPQGWYATRPWIDRPDADLSRVDPACAGGRFDARDALERWRRDGIVVFEQAVPGDLIEALVRDIERFVAEPRAHPISLDVDGRIRSLDEFGSEELRRRSRLKFYALLQHSAAARRLSLDPTVTAFLECVFRERPAPMSSLTFLNGSQQPAHADHAFVYRQRKLPVMAAAWIALEDVSSRAGPLAYYPGTHRVEDFGFFDFPGEGIFTQHPESEQIARFSEWLYERIDSGGYERRIFTPRRGDVLIWHAALVHEGLAIEDPALTRKSHVTHYTSEGCMPEDHIKRDWRDRPVAFTHGRGVAFQYPWVEGPFD